MRGRCVGMREFSREGVALWPGLFGLIYARLAFNGCIAMTFNAEGCESVRSGFDSVKVSAGVSDDPVLKHASGISMTFGPEATRTLPAGTFYLSRGPRPPTLLPQPKARSPDTPQS